MSREARPFCRIRPKAVRIGVQCGETCVGRRWALHRHIGSQFVRAFLTVPCSSLLPLATSPRRCRAQRRPDAIGSELAMADAPTRTPSIPRRTSPKSPPPPKLKLDEFKPILSATATNASSSSSSNNGSAFVFTSSRTSRSGFSSPASPPSSPLSDPRYTSKQRPVLTASQLSRHSLGALDARCIVGPNMRAAGFVPLAHNLTPQGHHHSQSLPSLPSDGGGTPSPSTLVNSGIPTPSEPPPFPPIMFIDPSQITAMTAWGYQHQLEWAVTSTKRGPETSPFKACAFGPAVASSDAGPSMLHSQSYASASSTSSMSASSSTSILSPIPTVSSLSSVPSTNASQVFGHEHSGPKSIVTVMKARQARSPAPPVDGYPFPHTPPRSTDSKSPSNSSTSTGVSAYTTATEHNIASTSLKCPPPPALAAPVALGLSPSSSALPSRPLPTSLQKEDKKPPSFRQSTQPLQRTRRNRSRSRSADLSLTELCESSSRGAWVTDPLMFGPFERTPRRDGSSSNSVSGSSSSGKASRGRSRTSSVIATSDRPVARERRSPKALIDLPSELADLSLAMESVKEESLEKDTPNVLPQDQAEKDREWARFKEAERKRRKGKERRRNKTDSDSDGKGDAGKGKLRSSGDKQSKARVHAQSFSSFSFPPGPSKPIAPHILGEHNDALPKAEPRERTRRSSNSRERREREREHRRGRDLGALVQAHRLHDREQAKQSERENRGREKQKAIATIDSEFASFDQKYNKHSHYSTKPSYLGDLTIDGESIVDLETRV
ncbi:hypothetical protein QCA50_001275 [Cerrena zonata]|uniref:Uncharacterized protein n=1 Tax=Cerrena zonata TaxID=2478898 RepID=A0AAW0GWC4_9APHY